MNKTVWLVSIIVIVVLAGFMFLRGKENEMPPPNIPMSDQPPQSSPSGNSADTIVVQHRFVNGTHLYTGTLTTPTPCYQVSADIRVLESYPEQLVLAFTAAAPPPDVMCVQVIAEQPFSVRVRASEEATVRGELNGRSVPLEVREGDADLREFETGIELVP